MILELLSGWSFLLFCVSLFFFFFRRSRSGSPEEKFTASDERCLRRERAEGESAEARSNDGEFPQDEEHISTQDESEESESLRRRTSGRKSDKESEKSEDGDRGADSSSASKENGSNETEDASQQSSLESRQDIAKTPEIVSSESTFQSGKEKETFCINNRQTIDNLNNYEIAADSSAQNSSSLKQDTFKQINGNNQREEITNEVPEIIVSEVIDEYNNEKEDINLEEESSVNNAYDIVNTSSVLKELSNIEAESGVKQEFVKPLDIVVKEVLVENQAGIELIEEDLVLPVDQTVKNKTASTINKSSNDANDFNISKDSHTQNKNEFLVDPPASTQREVEGTTNSAVGTNCVVSARYVNKPGVNSSIAEKFSGKLSRSVLDAVCQDTQLVYGRSEDGDLDNSTENALLKFSGILADSIVKTVLDFSKINHDEIDKHSELTTNGVYPHHSIDDSAEDLMPCDSTDEEFIRESVDKASHESLNEYAKELSEQILNGVYDLNGYCPEPAESSLIEVYITNLTETIISDAIKGARYCTQERKSLSDSNIDVEESLVDTFVDTIVGNILKDAISKVVLGDHREQTEDVDIQVVALNGHADGEDVSKMGELRENGKFQSKWLNEDDLDELYEEDMSDEGAVSVEDTPEDTSTSCTLTTKEQAAVWRKSLIQDLDDDMEFEDFENEQSSLPSSPTNSANGKWTGDSSSDEEDKMQDHSRTAKAPVISQTTTSTSGRTRLRSVDTTPVMVFDNGSSCLRVGFSGNNTPKEIIPSVVGTPLRYSQEISGMEYNSRPGLVFGDQAIRKCGVLQVDYPLKSDVIDKWADVEGLWSYVLGGLMGVQDNPEFPVLITQPALNPKKNTEKIAEIMFEHFHMPSLFIANQPALSLFSMGVTSGLSFCSGFNNTQAVVVYEGHILPHTVKQLDVAGYQLTENLKKLLMSRQGFGFRSSSQWQIVNTIKEKMGFVSLDFEAEAKCYRTQAELQQFYELPDGQVLEIGLERFSCAETLFKPRELGLTQSPAHTLITEAINSCEEELQELCYKSMSVSGGTTLMPGFVPRLEQELGLCDRKFKNFTLPEDRELATWIGGSVMASLPTFREMVVTIDEYADNGARVVHSKCF